MAKRNAEKELTDRNWDQEEAAEEVGTFSVASEEVLKSRAIKKAKRRSVASESESGGAFRGFRGLVAPPGAGGLFGNVAGVKPGGGLTNGGSTTPARAAAKRVTFGLGPESAAAGAAGPEGTTGDNQPDNQPAATCGRAAYHRQLAALNCSVRDWIGKHVDANPLCDLTPIFRDYERYLAGVEQLAAGPDAPAPDQKAAPFQFGRGADSGAALGPLAAGPGTFSFSAGSAAAQPSPAPSLPKMPESHPEGAAAAAEAVAESKGAAEEEEGDEPPKAEVTEVKEEDAFYSKKCKLFYKKDNEFKEKGVGTLHLKPAANQKTQLLVRADTNLGNILLNVLVPPNMPCSRTGKNNVLIVCVPNPPINEKNATTPVTMLIRVKTTEDADELHKILLEKKEA